MRAMLKEMRDALRACLDESAGLRVAAEGASEAASLRARLQVAEVALARERAASRRAAAEVAALHETARRGADALARSRARADQASRRLKDERGRLREAGTSLDRAEAALGACLRHSHALVETMSHGLLRDDAPGLVAGSAAVEGLPGGGPAASAHLAAAAVVAADAAASLAQSSLGRSPAAAPRPRGLSPRGRGVVASGPCPCRPSTAPVAAAPRSRPSVPDPGPLGAEDVRRVLASSVAAGAADRAAAARRRCVSRGVAARASAASAETRACAAAAAAAATAAVGGRGGSISPGRAAVARPHRRGRPDAEAVARTRTLRGLLSSLEDEMAVLDERHGALLEERARLRAETGGDDDEDADGGGGWPNVDEDGAGAGGGGALSGAAEATAGALLAVRRAIAAKGGQVRRLREQLERL